MKCHGIEKPVSRDQQIRDIPMSTGFVCHRSFWRRVVEQHIPAASCIVNNYRVRSDCFDQLP